MGGCATSGCAFVLCGYFIGFSKIFIGAVRFGTNENKSGPNSQSIDLCIRSGQLLLPPLSHLIIVVNSSEKVLKSFQHFGGPNVD